jgi:outer membrane protein insertion porin family
VNSLIVQDGPLALASSEASHSTLDQKNDPVTGGLQRLLVNVGHADLHTAVLESDVSGQHNFVRSSVELQRFINLQQPRTPEHPDADRNALAFRLQAGSAAGVLPFTEQYFLGGATGLRGYRDGRFWGQNMATGTVEYRHPLMRDFKGVLFADAGDAWGGNYQDVSLQGFSQTGFKVHASTGAGIRVGTPLGLVRLDYGYGDEGGRVHFGIGYSF